MSVNNTIQDLGQQFYNWLVEVQNRESSLVLENLSSLTAQSSHSEPKLNKPGIYFLFDPDQMLIAPFRSAQLNTRCVYVGITNKTLWHRLYKNHTKNIASSLPKNILKTLQNTNSSQTQQDAFDYVKTLSAICIPMEGLLEKTLLEAFSISTLAILSRYTNTANERYVEPSDTDSRKGWLGTTSPEEIIQRTGLWNIEHNEVFDLRIEESLENDIDQEFVTRYKNSFQTMLDFCLPQNS